MSGEVYMLSWSSINLGNLGKVCYEHDSTHSRPALNAELSAYPKPGALLHANAGPWLFSSMKVTR